MKPLRIRSVLVADDRSDATNNLVRAAAAIAALAEADLHVVQAVDAHSFDPDAEAGAQEVDPPLEEARETLRQQLRYSLPATVLVESCHVASGSPHAAILERAREVAADLIVIGPHRPRQAGDRVLGTTADRVIRTSDAPCLIVRAPLSLPLRRLLVATDLSEGAQRALEVACAWGAALRTPTARGGGTELVVAHVLTRDSAGRRARAEQELDARTAAAAEATGVGSLLAIRTEVTENGSAAEALLTMSRNLSPDLLVLGTHGRSTLGRALIGSVSSTVARKTEAPVLLVPPVPATT